MSRQSKAFAKSKISTPKSMPKKHTKRFWRTAKGTMIDRNLCSNITDRRR